MNTGAQSTVQFASKAPHVGLLMRMGRAAQSPPDSRAADRPARPYLVMRDGEIR